MSTRLPAVAIVAVSLAASVLAACAGHGDITLGPAPPPDTKDWQKSCPEGAGSVIWGECVNVDIPARENPLAYASWGPWAQSGDRFAEPTGTMTPPEAIPKTGIAEYSGPAFGEAVQFGPAGNRLGEYDVEGTINVRVDFAKTNEIGGVQAKIDLPHVNNNGVPVNVNASLTQNGYSGTQSYLVDPSDAWWVRGAFYGPDAAETAGTFGLGTFQYDGRGESTFSVRGTFGAKRCGTSSTPC
jgi:hypothetical protein